MNSPKRNLTINFTLDLQYSHVKLSTIIITFENNFSNNISFSEIDWEYFQRSVRTFECSKIYWIYEKTRLQLL